MGHKGALTSTPVTSPRRVAPCHAYSHDSLMVALTQAAASQPPAKQQLQADMAGPLEALNSGSGEQQQDMQQQQQQQAGEAGGRRRRGEEEVEEPLSPLGPAPLHRAPRDGIVLAAGELALRAAEERRRRMVSFVAVGALPGGQPGLVQAVGGRELRTLRPALLC